jgi:hypothetical protein
MSEETIKARIGQELIAALKQKNADLAATLRLLSAALSAREKELFAKGESGPLADAECVVVLQKEAKKRKESIAAFQSGNRLDLADKEAAELAIIQKFLPAEMSEEEIISIIDEVLQGVAADFGTAMRAVLAKTAGRADGKVVSELIKSRMK